MFGMNMWKSPEQVQQQRMQQLEAGASTLAQQVEVARFCYWLDCYFIFMWIIHFVN